MTISSDYYGNDTKWWVGIVKKNTGDPATVKVRIFGVHDMDDQQNIPNDYLPEALVLYPNNTADGSTPHNLKEEQWVVGIWADGDNYQQPIVIGALKKSNSSSSSSADSTGGTGGTGGTTGGGGGTEPTAPGNLPQGDNPKIVFNYIRTKAKSEWGVTDQAAINIAAAFVGAFTSESRVRVNRSNHIDQPRCKGRTIDGMVVSGYAYGLAQWGCDREIKLKKHCPGNKLFDINCQLDYFWWEMNGPYSSVKTELVKPSNSSSLAALAKIIIDRFERPAQGLRAGRYVSDARNALAAKNKFGNQPATLPPRDPASANNSPSPENPYGDPSLWGL